MKGAWPWLRKLANASKNFFFFGACGPLVQRQNKVVPRDGATLGPATGGSSVGQTHAAKGCSGRSHKDVTVFPFRKSAMGGVIKM